VISFYFLRTGVWTQDSQLESFQQCFFVMSFYELAYHHLFTWAAFTLLSSWSLPPDKLGISASWEARNTSVSHQHPVYSDYLKTWIITNLPCGYTVQHSRPPAFRTEVRMSIIKKLRGQASVTHQCNPNFLKGQCLRSGGLTFQTSPPWESGRPHINITTATWTANVAEWVEWLLLQPWSPEVKPQSSY
jgi:hypothetical protein